MTKSLYVYRDQFFCENLPFYIKVVFYKLETQIYRGRKGKVNLIFDFSLQFVSSLNCMLFFQTSKRLIGKFALEESNIAPTRTND